MKTTFKAIIAFVLFLSLSSFSGINDQDLSNKREKSTNSSSVSNVNIDNVVVTYNKHDIAGLEYVGCITITEKRWIKCTDKLKEETLSEIKSKTAETGGNIVYIDTNSRRGFGIYFVTDVKGCVYKK